MRRSYITVYLNKKIYLIAMLRLGYFFIGNRLNRSFHFFVFLRFFQKGSNFNTQKYRNPFFMAISIVAYKQHVCKNQEYLFLLSGARFYFCVDELFRHFKDK